MKTISLTLLLVLVLVATLAPARAAAYVVTALTDTGVPGELRGAITQANANPGSTITFANGVTGTITLKSPLPAIASTMTVLGPGASKLIVDGRSLYRPFFVDARDGVVTISGLTLQNGRDNDRIGGGAIWSDTELAVSDCVLATNTAVGTNHGGGAAMNWGKATFSNCVFQNNTATAGATDGGAVSSYGQLNIANCEFSGNAAKAFGGTGGAVSCPIGSLKIVDSSFVSNQAAGHGGAITVWSGSTATVSGCVFSGNTASGTAGAILNDSVLDLTNCTLVANGTASGDIGAIQNSLGSNATITNCTLAQNNGVVTGGISNEGQTILKNCVLWGNSGKAVTLLTGAVTATYCDITGGFTGTGNIDADPLFATAGPADNGGPTQTVALQAGSPCYGAGTATGAPATDQRGFTRPSPPSIGAFDAAATTATPKFLLTPGAFGSAQLVAITDATSGAVIYYTTDGSTPGPTSHVYSAAIPISVTTTLSAIAVAPGYLPSAVASARYVINIPPTTIAHILWQSFAGLAIPGGQSAIWSIKSDWSFTSSPAYGPFGSWVAQSIVDAPDGSTRMLWKDGFGHFSVWTIAASGAISSTPAYGPFAGWSASWISAGGDGCTRIMLKNTNDSVAVWTLDATGHFASSTAALGPFYPWHVTGFAVGGDNVTHLLWQNLYSCAVWSLKADGTFATSTPAYGPYGLWTISVIATDSDYMATPGIAAGADGGVRLLWGTMAYATAVWTLGGTGSSVSSTPAYGPFDSWYATSFAVGSDNATRLLWSKPGTSQCAVWLVGPSGSYTSSPAYGPCSGWYVAGFAAP